jgi:competence protein ComEC
MNERVDTAVVLGAAGVAGSLAVGAPWEVVAAGAIGIALARSARRLTWTLALAAVVVAALAALRAHLAVARFEQGRDAADAALGLPKLCSARAVVESSPVQTHDVMKWDGALRDVTCEGSPTGWSGHATLYGGPDDLARGDEVEIVANLGEPQRMWNEATGDPRPGEAHRGVVRTGGAADVRVTRRATGWLAAVDRARASVRARIDATFPASLAPMARALVLGESDLAADDDRSFRAAGLSHLLAVSGMHLVLVMALVVKVLEALLVRIEGVVARVEVGRVVAAVGIPVAWAYAELAGAGGSTVRAAWMATVALAARALGRRTDGPRAFGLSLVAMAASDPLVAFDLSFVLSAGATGGLLAFASPLSDRLEALSPARLKSVARAAGTTLAATIPCTPILARFAPTVPLGGVIANLLAVPVGEAAALPLCLVHALLRWWPAAERGCAAVASGALVIVRLLARGFAVPALTADIPQPTSWQMVVLTAALAVVMLGVARRGRWLLACAFVLLGLEVKARREGAPVGVLRATYLDVGQGDGAIVDLPDGRALLIDGGGLVGSPIDLGTRVIAPALRARRRGELAAVVLSHPHPDHFGGLATGLDAVKVDELWETGEGEAEGVHGGYAVLLAHARARGTVIRRPPELCGRHEMGGAIVEVLAPCPTFSSDWGPNDNSLVVRITYGARSLLFVGDAEHQAEATLLATVVDRLHADVLKVGHHGSRTSSTPAFIAAVAPRDAIISAGCRNRFGHPHPQTLATLREAGIRTWRTDLLGAVTVTTDGRSLDVHALGGEAATAPVSPAGR